MTIHPYRLAGELSDLLFKILRQLSAERLFLVRLSEEQFLCLVDGPFPDSAAVKSYTWDSKIIAAMVKKVFRSWSRQ